MKRVYDDRYIARKEVEPPRWLGPLKARNVRVWALGILLVLVFILFVSCLLTAADANVGRAVTQTVKTIDAPPGTKPDAPGVWANAAVLIDGESGRVLYDKNAHAGLPMASTTKMITALVVRDRLALDKQVQVPPEATQVGEQGIELTPGESLSVEQLLNALLIQSANDAAYTLAVAAGGSVDAFAALMNKKAAELGATDSQFKNPHGLDQAGHYSSAYDLAQIGRALMDDPVLAKMVNTNSYSIPWPGHPYARICQNHNEVLGKYEGADGIKTGYTLQAGQCLAASATRDDKRLIAVVLNSTHRADDVSCLFNYGFDSTVRVVLARKGARIARCKVSSFPRRFVNVVPSCDLAALTFKGSGDVFKVKATVAACTASPVKKGEKLGTIQVSLNNDPLASGNAVADRTAAASNVFGAAVAFVWYTMCWAGKIISAPFRIF